MPAPSTLFDPSAPVPEEFDVFCEGCGYSLVALSGDRCPECGRPFDPNEMPYARVPWLHRRRIGRWPAFWRTVRQVVRGPRDFAAELCRPVRISVDDARRFRKLCSIVAATSVGVAIVVSVFLADPPTRKWQETVGFVLMMVVGWWAAVIFFRLATDMPLFIWKGLPSMPAHELAPLHHYAAAPLALAPFVAAVVVGLPWLAVFTGAVSAGALDVLYAILLADGLLVAAWFVVCWWIPVALMRGATGASPRQSLALGAYLPVHVFLMFVVTWLGFMVCMIPLVQVMEYLERHF